MAQTGFHKWFVIAGWVLAAGAAPLVVRLVWEQTWLTREDGPGMVGFALMHGAQPVLLIVGALSLLLAAVWLVVAFGFVVKSRGRIGGDDWAPVVIMTLAFAVLVVPYGAWQWIVIKTLGPGPHPGSLLTDAALTGKSRVVRLLLAEGVDANLPDGTGLTALGGAAMAGREELVRLLLAHQARVSVRQGVRGSTTLMYAAESGHLEVVKLLLVSGADPKEKDYEGNTALDRARKNDHGPIVAVLEAAAR